MENKKHLHIRALCEGAAMVALAQILSYIKLFPSWPNGGSITLAAFPLAVFALRFGALRGLLASFVFGLLQLIFDGAYAWGWQSMLLDYLVAFTPLGIAGIFRGRAWGVFPGIALGNLLRFAVHYFSGVTIYRIYEPTEVLGFGIFDDAQLYSLVYNGSYMLANMLLCLAAAACLYVPMKRFFAGNDLR